MSNQFKTRSIKDSDPTKQPSITQKKRRNDTAKKSSNVDQFEPPTSRQWLKKTLATASITHAICHTGVLSRINDTKHLGKMERILYFGSDFLTNAAAYGLTRANPVCSTIHATIHGLAIAHLIGIETTFFKDVFSIADNGYSDEKIHLTNKAGYILGTLEDIVTHLLNAKALLN